MFQSDIASVIGDAKAWSDIGKNHSAFMASELQISHGEYTLFSANILVRLLVSVLSIVSPKKKPELYDKALAVSENQIKVLRSGIIDKTVKDEAVDNFGMKNANG